MMDLIHIQSKKQPTEQSERPTDLDIQSTFDEAQVKQGQFVF
jgi:hypothetical protein